VVDLQITGGEQAHALAMRLRRAANGGLDREVATGLDRATRKLDIDVRASAVANLPKRNGLNLVVARSLDVDTEKLTPLRLRVIAKGIDQLALIDAGKVVHPIYGRGRRRVLQRIPRARGWFDRPVRRRAGQIRRELRQAMNRTARKIT
jgi:hypothetical protein